MMPGAKLKEFRLLQRPVFLNSLLVAVSLGVAAMPALVSAQDSPDAAVGNTPASDFALFEEVESNTPSNRISERNNVNNRGTRNTQAAPTFTLVGTSRIGSKQNVILRHLNGDMVRVPIGEGTNPIPGHELYSVVEHGAGEVSVRYPSATPCGDYPDKGVSCDSATNVSSLRLTTAQAIAVATPVASPEDSEEVASDPEVEAEATEDAPRNPFAALRERTRNQNGNQPPSNFQPRRIPDDQVPPGYRKVSTPFGDRLVEI